MRFSLLILTALFTSCFSGQRSSRSSDTQDWSITPTIKSSKLKVTTSQYNSYGELHSQCIYVLKKLNFQIADSTNPIKTKPLIIYNGILARYYINFDSSIIIISGDVVEPSIGSSTDINSSNLNWKPIVKGTGQFGTPWFERMVVMAEAIRGSTIYYSD